MLGHGFSDLESWLRRAGDGVCTLVMVVALASCQDDPTPTQPGERTSLSAESSQEWTLVPTDTVRLQTAGGPGLGEIHEWATAADGRMAAVDRTGGRVHLFSPDGEQLRVLGTAHRLGEPMDAAFLSDGRLVVATLNRPQIHVFAADGTWTHDFELPGMLYALKVGVTAGDRIVVFNHRRQPTLRRLGLYDVQGNLQARFHPSREAYYSVPYWESTTERLLAATDSRIVAGGNLVYPFPVYDTNGAVQDSIGSAPPGWESPSRPERGAFVGKTARKDFELWRRSFTSIDRLAFVGDSLLAVVHERLDTSVLAYDRGRYSLDLYVDRRPVLRNHPLPGRVLEGGERLWVLTTRGADHWTVQAYRVQAPEGL